MGKPSKGLTISGIMKEFEISQEEFSLLFSCRQPQVSRWIAGAKPSPLRIRQILDRYQQIKINPQLVQLAREELLRRKKLYSKSFSVNNV